MNVLCYTLKTLNSLSSSSVGPPLNYRLTLPDCLFNTSTWHLKVNMSTTQLWPHLHPFPPTCGSLGLPSLSKGFLNPSSCSVQNHRHIPTHTHLVFAHGLSALPLEHIQHLTTPFCLVQPPSLVSLLPSPPPKPGIRKLLLKGQMEYFRLCGPESLS